MKKLLILAAFIGLSNPCIAYNDYGYSYGIATPYSGGFSSSMHVREMENDFARQQALNAPSISSTVHSSYSSGSTQPYQSTYTPSKSGVIDRPLFNQPFGR